MSSPKYFVRYKIGSAGSALKGGEIMETVTKTVTTDKDMELINKFSRRELSADEVYTFSVVAADDQLDRDLERFSIKALEQLSELFRGTTIIADHDPKAANQTARIYNAYTRKNGGVTQLVCQAYMLREGNEELIAKIESGILKEVSVGCAVRRKCSVCGKDHCSHIKGRKYDGVTCTFILDEAVDAYELSFVAVPAQREAGVIKCQKSFSTGGGQQPEVNELNTEQENLALRLKLEAEENYLKETCENGNE